MGGMSRVFTLAVVVTCATCSYAHEVYTYELIEGRNTLSYFSSPYEALANVSGRFQFALGEYGTIQMLSLDIRITSALVDPWSGVQPLPIPIGENLSSYLSVDFSNTTGIAILPYPLDGDTDPPLPTVGYVGPDVSVFDGGLLLGHDYFRLSPIGPREAHFMFYSRGAEEIGGEFRLFPPSYGLDPDENGIVPSIAFLTPNVRLVPEPGMEWMTLLALGGLFLLPYAKR